MNEEAQKKFRRKILYPPAFRLYLLMQLPSALFSGIRVRELTKERSVVTVPYKWLTKNPFRSVYFASQSMAAEMSTGVLAMMALQGLPSPVSMLVLDMKAEFVKKASSRISFTCEDGAAIFSAVAKAAADNEPVTVTARSTGTTADGTVISNFFITWTFKTKPKKA